MSTGDGALQIDDSLVSIITRETRLATFTLGMLEAGRAGAVVEGASVEQLASLDEAIQWLTEIAKGK